MTVRRRRSAGPRAAEPVYHGTQLLTDPHDLEANTMTTQNTQHDQDGNLQKNPEEWTTGDEPMTAAQRSYLETLAQEAGEDVEEDLTKAEASERIDALQDKTGRGT